MKLWIIDPGHGGMINAKYVTAPAKMHRFEDGLTIYEGVINRAITQKLASSLNEISIDYVILPTGEEDMPLQDRVEYVNEMHKASLNCVLLSIHSNAGGGKGVEVFTSKGKTKSDPIAEVFCKHYEKSFGIQVLRKDLTDGDKDKEENFYVLKNTICPAVLVENFFFDNRQEAEFLLSEDGQWEIAECLAAAISEIENGENT